MINYTIKIALVHDKKEGIRWIRMKLRYRKKQLTLMTGLFTMEPAQTWR